MSDVVVHLSVENTVVESKLTTVLDAFSDDAAAIKTTYSGNDFIRKSITFQDRDSARAFLELWRREKV